MRFLVLTSVIVAASTALVGSRPDQVTQLVDQSQDRVGGPDDQDNDRRPGTAPLVATPNASLVLHPATVTALVDVVAPVSSAVDSPVLAFAPKTSPPLSR